MPPYIVDANLLVRLITNDVPDKAREASVILQIKPEASVELPIYILAEVVYVLISNTQYRYSRERAVKSLLNVIEIPQFSVSHDTAQTALRLFRDTKLDFADCLLVAKHRLHDQTVLTFDKPLQKHLIKS